MSGTTDLQAKLTKARHRNAVLKTKLEKRTRALASLRLELAELRAFTLDVFPDHRVPPELAARLAALREEKLTFLAQEQLESLVSCVLEADAAGRPGILVEAGTALGGSAIAMALAKAPGRELRVHDVFGLIPPPGEEDDEDVHQRYEVITAGQATGREGDVYYGYREDLLGEVSESFARHGVPVGESGVTLLQGLFEDTITGDDPVALAHVDGDWYASTMTCLERLAPRLVTGGRLVIDDYYGWSGCRKAVDEYFADRPGYRVEMRAKVHVVREG